MVKKRTKNSKRESFPQKRRSWTAREDSAIRGLVNENGVKQWTLIAENLQRNFNISGRSGKQCRERWHNHLDSGILKQSWSQEEELTLFSMHQKLGNKWAEISKFIPGRTDNSIKNHFYSTTRKIYRQIYGKEGNNNDMKENVHEIVNSVLSELKNDQANSSFEENFTPDTVDDQIFPDLSDMIITGQHLDMPQDWYHTDLHFYEDQEILIFSMSPFENFDLSS